MARPVILSRPPRVCQRCFAPLPKHARVCPSCEVPQERLDFVAGLYNVLLALAVLGLLVGAGWILYRVLDSV